MTKGLRFSS